MWFHLRFWDLDFRIDGIIATAIAVLCALSLFALIVKDRRSGLSSISYLLLAASMTVFFSLNSTVIYTWPLVTQHFLPFSFLLLFFVLCHRSYAQCRYANLALALSTGAAVVAGDNIALVAIASACGVILLRTLKDGKWRSGAITIAVIVAAALATRFLLVQFLYSDFPSREGGQSLWLTLSLWERIPAIADWWRLIFYPAAEAVMMVSRLQGVFGSHSDSAMFIIGGSVILANGWFWWEWWKNGYGLSGHIAATILLYAYATTVAIAVVRVPQFDIEYLRQGRYVAHYQLALCAVLVMAGLRAGNPMRSWVRALMASAVAVIFFLEGYLSVASWEKLDSVLARQRAAANQIMYFGEHPENENPQPDSAECKPLWQLCTLTSYQRNTAIEVLKDHQLNVFSREFRERHGYETPGDIRVREAVIR